MMSVLFGVLLNQIGYLSIEVHDNDVNGVQAEKYDRFNPVKEKNEKKSLAQL